VTHQLLLQQVEEPTRKTQADRLLRLLESKEWVTLPEILDLRIACHTRRISELREQGHDIECEKTWVNGVQHTRYRLRRA
jgi:hypothetical protein